MLSQFRVTRAFSCALVAIALTACLHDSGSTPPPSPPPDTTPATTSTYSVGGTVAGLAGSGLVLNNNGGNALAITTNGNFTFSTSVTGGSAYLVAVATQPSNPVQNCSVGNGGGTIASANATTVTVTCVNVYKISGSVTGLNGSGLVLQNNGANDLAIAGNGAFEFAGTVEHGQNYHVTVLAAPANHTCTLQNNGPAAATADVSGIIVTCVSTAPPPAAPIVPMDVTPGFREVTASWITTGATYNLYYSTAPGCDITNYSACPSGTRLADVKPPVTIANVYNGLQYYFRLEAVQGGNTLLSDEVLSSPHAYIFDGGIFAIEGQPGSTMYLGGSFGRVGLRSPYGAPIDLATGQLPDVFPQVNGTVNAAVADGQGGWYIGGNFTRVGGHVRYAVAHILAGGIVDPAWQPRVSLQSNAGWITTLVLAGDRVYIGGRFDQIDGATYTNLAAIGVNGAALAWNPAPSAAVNAIAVGDGVVYVAGTFANIGGGARAGLAAVDMNGAATNWNPQPNMEVRALAYDATDKLVYVGGIFTQMGTTVRSYLAAVGADGSLTDWNPGVGGWVRTITLAGNVIYVGGEFLKVGTATRISIAAFEKSGALSAWDPQIKLPGGYVPKVNSIAVAGSSVYVGGDFGHVDDQSVNTPRNYVFEISTSTPATLRPWDPSPFNRETSLTPSVRTLAVSGNQIYLGGEFSSAQSAVRTRIARLGLGGRLESWAPKITGGHISDIKFAGDALYVCGNLGYVDGQFRIGAASFKKSEGTLTAWSPSFTSVGTVNSLASTGDAIYLGGEFSVYSYDPVTMASATHRNTVAYNATDPTKVLDWNPPAAVVPITKLALGTGMLGSDFLSAGGSRPGIPGTTMTNLAQLGSNSVQWSAQFDGPTRTFDGAFGGLAVGGDFRNVMNGVNLEPHLGFAIFSALGAVDAWDPGFDGAVLELKSFGNKVYVGGGFTKIGTATRGGLAAFSQDRVLAEWGPILGNYGNASLASASVMRVFPDRVFVGGSFSTIGGSYLPLYQRPYATVGGITAGGFIELPP